MATVAHRSRVPPVYALVVFGGAGGVLAACIYSGSKGQHIKLWSTTSGEPMGTLRYHQGFLGQRIGPVSCLCFHRHKMFLAIGATDSIVSIYTGHQ